MGGGVCSIEQLRVSRQVTNAHGDRDRCARDVGDVDADDARSAPARRTLHRRGHRHGRNLDAVDLGNENRECPQRDLWSLQCLCRNTPALHANRGRPSIDLPRLALSDQCGAGQEHCIPPAGRSMERGRPMRATHEIWAQRCEHWKEAPPKAPLVAHVLSELRPSVHASVILISDRYKAAEPGHKRSKCSTHSLNASRNVR